MSPKITNLISQCRSLCYPEMSVFSFHIFVFLYQFLTMLTLPYPYNWQKFNNKMNEKKKPRVSGYGP